jgi:ATP-binding cassette subfamily F protein uup
VSLEVDQGEFFGLLGPNGAGKTTLINVIAGLARADAGTARVMGADVLADYRRARRMLGVVPQELVFDPFFSVRETLRLQSGYYGIRGNDGWIDEVMQHLDLASKADANMRALSGGMKRRVLLARALVSQPDLLLLDEPTNHLDIAAIDWLEGFLKQWNGALVFVTHDRRFLRALATRIVEIDRGQVTSWPGDWDNYLRRKEERANAEAQENARFDKLLAQEEVWIRQGIKARRTRDEGRVRRLKAMRAERAERRVQAGNVRMATAQAGESGKKVIEAKSVSFAYEDKSLVRDFSTTILRGDRIGLVGPNGSGKTTLLKLLLGELAPRSGEVKQGTQLQVAYFDQYRATLREDWNAIENVAEGRESVNVGGKPRHVIGYLQDFLFTPERARAPITRLSGGERNRLLLAKLFAQPSNLLVMDEPTNDLDVETLELLEELLADYPGTLLLVSHDRDFLDNVVTSTIVMEGEGRIGEYVGGYSDWLRQRPAPAEVVVPKPQSTPPAKPVASPPAAKTRLSYKDARELEQLPARIETLEAELARMTAAMNEPAFYQRDAAEINADNAALAKLQAELDVAYARWAELEG